MMRHVAANALTLLILGLVVLFGVGHLGAAGVPGARGRWRRRWSWWSSGARRWAR